MGQEGLGKDWRTFGTYLERGLGRSARGDEALEGTFGEGEKHRAGLFYFLFFLPDSADKSARRVKGLRKVSSSFCKGVGRMERGGRRGGGSPARGAGVEQPRGWDSGQRALPPGGLRAAALWARAPGSRGAQAAGLHKLGWGQRKGASPHPGSASSWGPLKMSLLANETSASLLL